jgi:predicted membrane protein
MKKSPVAIFIYALVVLAFVEMGFGSFRIGALLIAAALGVVLVQRIRARDSESDFFANRALWIDVTTLSFLLISLTILAVVVPSPQ